LGEGLGIGREDEDEIDDGDDGIKDGEEDGDDIFEVWLG
jgi:hypothetical protein